jgi:hypothetical protein
LHALRVLDPCHGSCHKNEYVERTEAVQQKLYSPWRSFV